MGPVSRTRRPCRHAPQNAGSCRQTSLSLSTLPDPENVTCQDWGTATAASLIGAYQVDFRGPGTARLLAAVALPQPDLTSLQAGVEYYSFTLRIRHDKTVGAGSCAGCDQPLAIVLNSINVTTDTPASNFMLSGPLNGVDANFAVWTPAPVPTRATSWSALKARFR